MRRWPMEKQILDEQAIRRALTRIAHEMIEKNKGVHNCILLGIKTRGIYLAERLAKNIEQIEGEKIDVAEVEVTLYRDDLPKEMTNGDGEKKSKEAKVNVTNKTIILVDDVLY